MTRKATVPIVLTLPWLTSSAIGALLLLVVSSVRADAPPSPNWLKEITRVAYTGLPNSQRWADWPDRVIADFASAGVQMMFSRVHNGRDSPGLAWRSAYGDPDPAMQGRDGTREVVALCRKHNIRKGKVIYLPFDISGSVWHKSQHCPASKRTKPHGEWLCSFARKRECSHGGGIRSGLSLTANTISCSCQAPFLPHASLSDSR